ncbi:MAG: hypothetical protein PHC90_01345 [Syntrophorhabdaceae bacterium]|nr:hypothetical protein [Syntrophorhabdaceae bacterium]
MAELSQSDLDALFAGDAPTPAQQEAEPSELDKLMSDLASLGVNTRPEEQETSSVDSLSDKESLSQDQIDELLKEFLG